MKGVHRRVCAERAREELHAICEGWWVCRVVGVQGVASVLEA